MVWHDKSGTKTFKKKRLLDIDVTSQRKIHSDHILQLMTRG